MRFSRAAVETFFGRARTVESVNLRKVVSAW